ncbi:MAG TPA: DUF6599 family protein [Ignavibacteriales bacterium]|nr:DUF6599 family protein [Ignavibacteriales bacterium]
MKNKVITLFILILFFTSGAAFAQSDEMPGILLSDIPSGEILRNDYFDGKSLWGYIDGGADVYLEYGFSKLRLQEVNYKNHHFKLEVYRMKDPQASFGIFSISRFKCIEPGSFSRFSCISNYQVQTAWDRYYISAINDNGTVEEVTLSKELVSIITGKIAQDSIEIPGFFRKRIFAPYLNELKLFHGKLGVQNGFPAWSDQFDRYGKFSMYILPIETSSGYAYVAKIKFSSAVDMKDFHEKAGFKNLSETLLSVSKNGILKAMRKTGDDELVYFETNFPSAEAGKFLKEID